MIKCLSLLFLAGSVLFLSSCANAPAKHSASASDDRPYNPQTSRFETKTQAEGIDAQRQHQ